MPLMVSGVARVGEVQVRHSMLASKVAMVKD